jgi:hypothetical protein
VHFGDAAAVSVVRRHRLRGGFPNCGDPTGLRARLAYRWRDDAAANGCETGRALRSGLKTPPALSKLWPIALATIPFRLQTALHQMVR